MESMADTHKPPCELKLNWGELLATTLTCEGGFEEVTRSTHLNRLYQFAVEFENGCNIQPPIFQNRPQMMNLIQQHIYALHGDELQLFTNYVNSPFLDHLLKVFDDVALPPAIDERFPVGSIHRQVVRKYPRPIPPQDALYKAMRFGFGDVIDLFPIDQLWSDMYEMGIADAIILGRPPLDFIRKHAGPDTPRLSLIRAACCVGDYPTALELAELFDGPALNLSQSLWQSISDFPCFPGWSETYMKIFTRLEWNVCFEIISYGGICTDAALFERCLDTLSGGFALYSRRAACGTAIRWGHIHVVEQILSRSRVVDTKDYWHMLLDRVLHCALFGGLLSSMVPTALMLARQRSFDGVYHVFDLCQCPLMKCIESAKEVDSNWHESDVHLPPQTRSRLRNTGVDTVFNLLFQDCSDPTVMMVGSAGPVGSAKDGCKGIVERLIDTAHRENDGELLEVIGRHFPNFVGVGVGVQ
jgi:hypothetical protein